MKPLSSFKFDTIDKKRWQECADKRTKGNLTRWIEMVMNKSSDRILGKREDDKKLLP